MKVEVKNPDSLILQQVDGQWQKLVALIIWKLAGHGVVRITDHDIEQMALAFAPSGPVVFTHGLSEAIELSLVSEEAAERIVAHDRTQRGAA